MDDLDGICEMIDGIRPFNPFKLHTLQPVYRPEFPSTWFKNHPSEKPPITIPATKSLKELTSCMMATWSWSTIPGPECIVTNNKRSYREIPAPLPVEFLAAYIKENIKDTLSEDWTSYGVKIGSKGQTITPLDLLEVSEVTTPYDTITGAEVTPLSSHQLFAKTLIVYKLSSLSAGVLSDFKRNLVNEMLQTVRGAPFFVEDEHFNINYELYTSWVLDKNFCALVACIDMFFNKFPTNVYSKIRVCTETSRLKDCAALETYEHLSKLIGKPKIEAIKYIYDPDVAQELKNKITEEEVDIPDSYFPYFKELLLSRKSPYSCNENQNFNNWVHMLGSFLGDRRSLNARLIGGSHTLEGILNQTMAVAYFLLLGNKQLEANPGPATKGDEAQAINDPLSIYRQIKELQGKMPQTITTTMTDRLNSVTGLRQNSIGKYLQDCLNHVQSNNIGLPDFYYK